MDGPRSGAQRGWKLEEIKNSFRMLKADALSEKIECERGRIQRRRYRVDSTLSY